MVIDSNTFITASIQKHGNTYDYSLVNYTTRRENVQIICSIHGIFEQLPGNHLRGNGCKKCARLSISGNQQLSKSEFSRRATQIHNDKYDYSLVDYKSTNEKIIIICPIHGQFNQTPKNHLYLKQGCKECSKSNRINTNLTKYGGHPKTTPEVQEKYRKTCLEKYGVENPQQNQEVREKTKQTNLERYGAENPIQNLKILNKQLETFNTKYGCHPTKLPIIQDKKRLTNIKKYGVEYPQQTVDVQEKIKQTNLEKYGVCWNIISETSITKKKKTNLEKYGGHSSQQHMIDILPLIENYDWLYEQYIIQQKTALYIAKELGINDGTLGRYLKKAEIQIKKFHQSFISKLWLQSIQAREQIEIIYEYQWDKDNLRTKADGYCLETNTIYEFHGDYWHGNPEIYSPDIIHPIIKKSMGELYRKTICREERITTLGYNLIVMWENDFI